MGLTTSEILTLSLSVLTLLLTFVFGAGVWMAKVNSKLGSLNTNLTSFVKAVRGELENRDKRIDEVRSEISARARRHSDAIHQIEQRITKVEAKLDG